MNDWICCNPWIMHSPLVESLRNESGGHFGLLRWVMTPSKMCQLCECSVWMWPSQSGSEFYNWASFLQGRTSGILKSSIPPPQCLFIASRGGCSSSLFYVDQRLHHHTPKNSPTQLWGSVCANLASANESVGYGLPYPDPARAQFSTQLQCLAFLVDTFFFPKELYHHRYKIIGQRSHLYHISNSHMI